jgi:hypothetical protein
MTRALSTLVALMLLALPAAAMAQEPQTNAPPGNSAIDEYLETVPSSTGNQRPRQPGSGGANGSGPVLTAAQRKRLERLGPDGKILADAVDATAPPAAKPRQKIDPTSAEGRSPIAAILEAAVGSDGGDGMGIFLPVILLGSLLGVIALVMLRRRSPS